MGKQGTRLRLSDEDRRLIGELVYREMLACSAAGNVVRKFQCERLLSRVNSPKAGHPLLPSVKNLSDSLYGNAL